MPSSEQHHDQRDRNIAVSRLAALQDDQHRDWKITALFYAAVHHVEDALAKRNEHPKGHENRRQLIKRFYGDGVMRPFQSLYNYSVLTRYECWKPTEAEAERAERFYNAITQGVR